jgi:hypothetical protein
MKGVAMTKRKKKKNNSKEHTQLFHEVLEPMSYFNFTANEMSFILVLWRFTWGLKGMKYKVEAGKSVPWVPALFIYKAGLKKHLPSRIKNRLIEDRVVNQRGNGTFIGFNKRWQQWKRTPRISKAEIARRLGVFPTEFTALLIKDSKEEDNGLPETSTVTSNVNSDSYLKRQQELPETSKVVTSNVNSTDPKHCQQTVSTAPKDKERKGEIKLNVEERIEIFDVFWKLWLSIYELPASHKQSKPDALSEWTKLVNLSGIHPERLVNALKKDKDGKFARLVEEAGMRGDAIPGKYLPGAVKWLRDFPVNHLSDGVDVTEPPLSASEKKELRYWVGAWFNSNELPYGHYRIKESIESLVREGKLTTKEEVIEKIKFFSEKQAKIYN